MPKAPRAPQLDALEIRALAERKLAAKALTDTEGNTFSVLNELRIHEIELEMQNEALRQALADLEDSRDAYQELFDQAPVAYITVTNNRAGRIVDANKRAVELLGSLGSTLVNAPFARFVKPESLVRWDLHLAEVLKGNGSISCELTLVGANHRPLRVHIQSVQNHRGDNLVSITLIDVTETHAIHQELRLRSEIASNMAEGVILIKAPSGTIVYANPRLESILGYASGELASRHISHLNGGDPSLAVAVSQQIAADLIRNGNWHGDLSNCRQDGSEVLLRWTVSTLEDSELGTVWVSVCSDISKLRVAEIEREQAYVELRRLTENASRTLETERAELARDVHDQIGASLTGIRMRLEELANFPAEANATMSTELMSIVKMTQAAMVSSREICNRLRPTMFDDLGLVETCRWYLRDWAKLSGIEVKTRFDRNIPNPDPKVGIGLFRILQELLTNIGRHSGASRVGVSLSDGGSRFRMRVADNGCGFPHSSESAGFGLAGIRERVSQLGGHIEFTSSTSGVTVVITIPRTHTP
jgi:PAS domain S-box-containing protein